MSKIVNGWTRAKLSDISEKIWIGLVTTMTKHYVERGVPLIRNSDIKEGYIDKSKLINLSHEFAGQNSNRAFKIGDIATVHTGDCGTSSVIDSSLDGAIGFATLNTRIKEGVIYNRYLCSYFNSDVLKSQVYRVITGDGRNNLNMGDFVHLEVIYPDCLKEQKKIAEILTSVDKVIELTEIEIEKLKNLKKGMMQDLLTKGIGHTKFKDSPIGKIPESWEVKDLGKIFDFKNGLNKEKKYFGYGVPIVNYMDVFRFSGMNRADIKGKVDVNQSEIDRFEVKKGDVFFTRTSETLDEIGMASVLMEDLGPAVFSGFVLRAREKKAILELNFKKYALSSDYIRVQITRQSALTTRALTSGTALSRVLLAIPPKEEQAMIANAINSIEDAINIRERMLVKNRNLKKGLMQDLLTGKVRVKV